MQNLKIKMQNQRAKSKKRKLQVQVKKRVSELLLLPQTSNLDR
jgi:hypothetical protein